MSWGMNMSFAASGDIPEFIWRDRGKQKYQWVMCVVATVRVGLVFRMHFWSQYWSSLVLCVCVSSLSNYLSSIGVQRQLNYWSCIWIQTLILIQVIRFHKTCHRLPYLEYDVRFFSISKVSLENARITILTL